MKNISQKQISKSPIQSILLFSLFVFLNLSIQSDLISAETISLSQETENRCLKILREGMQNEEFWPSIHAAEGLTLSGHGNEVIQFLKPKLKTEKNPQKLCGISRELIRAGEKQYRWVMLNILEQRDTYGHIHASESLYKVGEIGDGFRLRQAMTAKRNPVLQLMASAALAKAGSPAALKLIRKYAQSDDEHNMMIACWVLGRIGDSSDIPQLKKNEKRAKENITRVYCIHSLAALGDSESQKKLINNLSNKDAAVRTYAAVFASEAGMVSAKNELIKLLDDEGLDVRIRAAQSLMVLSKPLVERKSKGFTNTPFQATEKNPRYSEGSLIVLNDGSLLLATTEFQKDSSDYAKAHIVSKKSIDGGKTWGESVILQKNVGKLNVMSVTLRKLNLPHSPTSSIGFFYLIKNAYNNLHAYVRISHDEGKTFGEPIKITSDEGYHVLNNDRITLLANGRLLVPVASTLNSVKENHFICRCCYSDDGGLSWKTGEGFVDLPKRGAMEPEVIELVDGKIMMIMRNQLGTISKSYSTDRGETWSDPEDLGVKAPEAPSTLRRIPSTGDLVLIWNHTYSEGKGHGGKRTPLTAAISSDEGKTWKRIQNIETDANQTYSYISLTFTGDRALMSYYVNPNGSPNYSLRFRSIPISWFYQKK